MIIEQAESARGRCCHVMAGSKYAGAASLEVKLNRPGLYRGLRIAVSAVCGMACLLLIVLWVRSYFTSDQLTGGIPRRFHLVAGISKGRLLVVAYELREVAALTDESVRWSTTAASQMPTFPWRTTYFNFKAFLNPPTVSVPQWFPVFLSGLLATLPWIEWRFSLSRLLIGVTVFAIGLGVIAFLGEDYRPTWSDRLFEILQKM